MVERIGNLNYDQQGDHLAQGFIVSVETDETFSFSDLVEYDRTYSDNLIGPPVVFFDNGMGGIRTREFLTEIYSFKLPSYFLDETEYSPDLISFYDEIGVIVALGDDLNQIPSDFSNLSDINKSVFGANLGDGINNSQHIVPFIDQWNSLPLLDDLKFNISSDEYREFIEGGQATFRPLVNVSYLERIIGSGTLNFNSLDANKGVPFGVFFTAETVQGEFGPVNIMELDASFEISVEDLAPVLSIDNLPEQIQIIEGDDPLVANVSIGRPLDNDVIIDFSIPGRGMSNTNLDLPNEIEILQTSILAGSTEADLILPAVKVSKGLEFQNSIVLNITAHAGENVLEISDEGGEG